MGGNANKKEFDNQDDAVEFLAAQHHAAIPTFNLISASINYDSKKQKYIYESYYEV